MKKNNNSLKSGLWIYSDVSAPILVFTTDIYIVYFEEQKEYILFADTAVTNYILFRSNQKKMVYKLLDDIAKTLREGETYYEVNQQIKLV